MSTTTTTTFDLLSPETWTALAGEYLPSTDWTARPQIGQQQRDHGTAQAWYELLDHVRWQTGWEPDTFLPAEVTTLWGDDQLRWAADRDADALITSFADLKLWAASDTQIPLSDLHHDHPIFTREDNLRFRAWHDTAHLEHGLAFDATSELKLYGLQGARLVAAGLFDARDALFCESVYQLAAAVHLGTYPERQYCRKLGPVGRAVRDLLINL
jgi:hypothetical protein